MKIKFIKKAVIGDDWYQVDDELIGRKELLQPYIECNLAVEMGKDEMTNFGDNEDNEDIENNNDD